MQKQVEKPLLHFPQECLQKDNNIFNKLKELLDKEEINMISGLLSQRGVGINTIEKLLQIKEVNEPSYFKQKTLFSFTS